MRHLPIIGLLLLSVSCWAQVTHDVDSTTTKQLGVSTFNWSHLGGTLTNGGVVIGVSIYGNGVAAPSVSTITYGAVSASLIKRQVTPDTFTATELWCAKGLSSGTQTVTVTMSGATPEIEAGATTFNGVNQTTPCDNAVGQSGNSISGAYSQSVTSAASNQVYSVVAAEQVVTAGNTQAYNVLGNSLSGAGEYAAGAASVSMSWTISGGGVRTSMASADVAAVVVPPGSAAFIGHAVQTGASVLK